MARRTACTRGGGRTRAPASSTACSGALRCSGSSAMIRCDDLHAWLATAGPLRDTMQLCAHWRRDVRVARQQCWNAGRRVRRPARVVKAAAMMPWLTRMPPAPPHERWSERCQALGSARSGRRQDLGADRDGLLKSLGPLDRATSLNSSPRSVTVTECAGCVSMVRHR